MTAKRPLILVSNDDGITAKGISHLVALMRTLGEVVVVAPDSPQSGMGHAITIHDPLKYQTSSVYGPDVQAYACSGTPADCVKLAKNHLLKGRQPDLVVSGINHGSNASVSVLYSGTMSAAVEAAIEDLPAIGFSVSDFDWDADFSHTSDLIVRICKDVLANGLPKNIALNVNFPKKADEPLKGMRVCRQAKAKWQEEFDERRDPYGRRYLWLTGYFLNQDQGEDTDVWALSNGYASVVPVSCDMTAHAHLRALGDRLS